MKQIILFDLDGTLINSTEAILESFYYSFDKNKDLFVFDQDNEAIKQYIGYTLEDMFGALGVPTIHIDKFVASYKEHYRKISNEKTILLPDAKEAIKLASSFATLGIVTTKTTQYSKILLEHMGILSYFDTIIGRQDVTHPKPHPEPILKALDTLKVTPSKDIFMIGDTPLDLICAKDAGISSVGVLCGYGTQEQMCKYDTKIVTNSFEAVKYIKNNQF